MRNFCEEICEGEVGVGVGAATHQPLVHFGSDVYVLHLLAIHRDRVATKVSRVWYMWHVLVKIHSLSVRYRDFELLQVVVVGEVVGVDSSVVAVGRHQENWKRMKFCKGD